MPVRKVNGGYRWGQSGKVYPTKAQAQRQGRAIYAAGYQEGGVTEARARNLLDNIDERSTDEGAEQTDERSVLDQLRDIRRLSNEANMMRQRAINAAAREHAPAAKKIPGQMAQGLASGLLGAPVDIASMVMRPFGYDVPPEETVGATEWWGTKFGADPTTIPFIAGSMGPLPDATDAMRMAAQVDPAMLTGILGMTALGKTDKTARIASKSDEGIAALQADVTKFAVDESGFVSPTIKALIEKAPPNLKGQQIVEWAKANANKGVKPKELEFLGLDEFVAANPNATTREAIEGISGNKVSVSKNIYSGNEAPVDDMVFEITVPEADPLDGSSLWQNRVEDLHYDLKKGRGARARFADEYIKKDLLDHYNKEWDVSFESFDDIPESMIDEVVEDFAKDTYMQNPYEMLTPEGQYPDTFAFGNDDVGYQLFVDGERVTDTDNIAYSRTEAEIQLKQKLGVEDYGIEGETQFKQYVDESLPGGENYREVVFNWDNAPQTHSVGHFDDDTQIAHALTRDRKLEDGTGSLHIDELQSDLHTRGSKSGYKVPKARELKAINEIEKILEDTPVRYAEQGAEKGILVPDAAGAEPHFINFDLLPSALERSPAHMEKWGGISRESELKFDIIAEHLGSSSDKLLEAAEPFMRASSKAPNYPYKDNWHEMVLKNLLLDAAREGKPALSVSGSAAIKARYSDEYSKFYEMLYDKKVPSFMKKLAKRYGGKFEKGRLDLDDTFGKPQEMRNPITEQADIDEHYRLLNEDGFADANIIKITPEMRARILEEGIPSFAAGGIVGVIPSIGKNNA